MDIMFYEAFDEEARLLRRLMPAHVKAGFTSSTVQASGDEAPPARLISIRTQSAVPAAWASQLDGILSRSAGFDHLSAYRRRAGNKVRCGYLPSYCSRAVAEQAALLMMALLRKLPRQVQQFGVFDRDGLTGGECAGRACCVVGVGNIGSQAARIARGLGMNVLGVDIKPRHKGIKYVTLAQGVRDADAVIVAVPLTPKTRGMLGYKTLARSGRCPVVVNIARGEVTPFADLARLLEEKKISGVGLDVFSDEDVLADALRCGVDDLPVVRDMNRLRKLENVIMTPHNAFNTKEALQEKCRQTLAAVTAFLKNNRFPCEVTA